MACAAAVRSDYVLIAATCLNYVVDCVLITAVRYTYYLLEPIRCRVVC